MGAPSQVSAGGSLANTLVGVARLSRASGQALRVALGGSLGTDTLGQFFTSQMRHAGVRCVLDSHHPPHAHGEAQDRPSMPEVASMQHQAPGPSGHTGTVMVLTTPDAQRSFLSFFAADRLELSERLRAAVRSSRMVVLEGYLWELPGAEEYMMEVLRTARAAGAQVAMTAGDPGVVSRHRAAMLRVVRAGIDMLFTNEDEAVALVGSSPSAPSSEGEEALVSVEDAAALAAGGRSGVELAALQLAAVCPMVVVTAGSKGSFVAAMGQLHEVPPYWLPQGPVDTCGAGDAYMAGFCYAVLAGYDLRTAGEFASRTASAVIGRFGPHLSDEDAELLVAQLPEHTGALRVALGGAGAVELGAGEFEGL
ncbi:hypothetical protein HYH03_018625 [Edaphochlamys debaryana]|uniref:Carbohydrate kinase PfkB domain-containing protein n=1 Tax=Edaphochlamys debaryana TaxID=47281 RepID=A0A836BMS1_9CHLO|nr:hypothetical protein HYH03_018625 [Edaphochlamys debaryana]|eukprot:KAG2482456.1 hypothetical protein HYH03_018625 [Edaphochlamys debaryana]